MNNIVSVPKADRTYIELPITHRIEALHFIETGTLLHPKAEEICRYAQHFADAARQKITVSFLEEDIDFFPKLQLVKEDEPTLMEMQSIGRCLREGPVDREVIEYEKLVERRCNRIIED